MKTFVEIIREHIVWRHQLIRLAKADLVKTYSGAALGWAWALVKPIMKIFVFWFAFSFGLRMGGEVDGHPFFLWLIAGFVPWFYMSEMITGGAGCIRGYRYLVTKMKFPVVTIPTFIGLSKLVIHILLFFITIVVFIAFGYLPDIFLLQIPLYMILMFTFFYFWALFSGMLSAISKDFQGLVKSFTTVIFWLSGIIYDINGIEIPWIKTVLSYNPVTIIASGYRHAFVDKTWFWEHPDEIRNYIILLIIMICLAIWAYRKTYREIPDVL